MKKKKIFLIFTLFVIIFSNVFAQVEITKSDISYSYEEQIVNLCYYVVKNTSDTTVFLWFDREQDRRIPLPVRTHNYLLMSYGKRSLSFYNLLCELGVTAIVPNGGLIPCVGYTFIKKLKKNQSFTIILKDQSIDDFSEDFIEIVPIDIFEEVCPFGKRRFDSIEYKEDFIVF